MGSALEGGLTETRAGEINDRENLFGVALNGRLNVGGITARLVHDGLSYLNRPEGSGLLLKHNGEVCADRAIASGIAGYKKHRRHPKHDYDFEPIRHGCEPKQAACQSPAVQLQGLRSSKHPVYYFINNNGKGTPHSHMLHPLPCGHSWSTDALEEPHTKLNAFACPDPFQQRPAPCGRDRSTVLKRSADTEENALSTDAGG